IETHISPTTLSIFFISLSVGFSNNQFNYGDGNDNVGNSVQLVSSTKTFPCDVEKHISYQNQIIYIYSQFCNSMYFFSEITSISPSSGSVEGGTIITVTGRYFDQTDSPAKVHVGGQDCVVLSLTDTQITCKSPPKPATLPTLFPGNRGMKIEKWNNIYSLDGALEFNNNTPGYEGESWVDGAFKTWPDYSFFVARLSGFLVPSETDYYRFYIRGDDAYFMNINISSNSVRVENGYATGSYYSDGRQRSEEFFLKEGKPYYIEAYVQNYGGLGSIDVGLYKRSSSYLEGQTPEAINEVQFIQSQTATVRETQTISLRNWNTSTPVQEVQTITITKDCFPYCIDLFYKLIYDKEKTDILSADATADEVQSALNNLWSLKPDSVEVTMESDELQTVYNVTFISQRGDFQLLSYEKPEGSNMTIDVEEQIKGVPDMNTVTLVWDGVYSRPLAVNASSGEVGCIYSDYYRGSLAYYPVAFCGRYSLLNPRVLYNSEDSKSSQAKYGNISLTMHSQVRSISIWTYTCIDMLNLFKANVKGKNFKVSTISIEPTHWLYIDDLYIGQVPTSDSMEGRAIQVHEIIVNQLSNEPTNNQYSITFVPNICEYGFPIFSLGFVNETNPVNGTTYSAPTWPKDSFIQINQTQAASPPIGGNFSIQAYGKEITGKLAKHGANVDLQYALQTIPELGEVSVYSRYGSCTGYNWYIKFLTAAGYHPLLQINDSAVTGVNAKISAVKITSGGLFRQHLYGDLVRTPHSKPQLHKRSCILYNFEYSFYVGGTLVTIFGKGFGNDSEVQFGIDNCDVIFANLTRIQCRTQGVNFFIYSFFCMFISGGTILTIIGFDFNNQSTRSAIFIGNKTCKIQEWSPTIITCILPSLSPGEYDILVYVENMGFASSENSSSVSIEYILEVNSIFPQYGSVYGGTKITLTGSGFNEVLEINAVQIGSVPCDVTSSSDTELTCIIQRPGNVHNVTNTGAHAVYGFGYAWSPSRLEISVGDTVVWTWNTQALIQDVGYRVFSVSEPASLTYDGKGFYSGNNRLSSGIFSYHFTSPGVYYYSSGYLNSAQSIFMQGVVYVSPLPDQNSGVYLSVGGIEADYVPAEGPAHRSLQSRGAGAVCPELSDVPPENNDVWFGFTKCYSATITKISPSSGTIYTSITINGTGFSSIPCANQVSIGKYPCTVSHADGNSIVCQVDPQNAMSVGIAELVSLNVTNLGNAINMLTQEMERRFALLPHIDTITPANGSTTGFTRLTIQGSGFSDGSSSITIAGIDCSITSVNYTHIICDTKPSYTHDTYISVSVNGIPCQCMDSCYFLYTADVTPVISIVYPINIHNTSTTFYIDGSGFGDNVDDILVYAGDVMLEVVDVNDTLISCSIDPLPAGTYAVQVIVLSKGLASGNPTISSPAEATIITTSGSIEGGTVLVIQGNGFYSLNATKVSIGGILCPIISVSPGEIRCVTPAASYEGQRSVIIVVQTIQYPTQSFTYSESDTPIVTAVLPDTGPTGTLITVSGCLFGVDATQVEVTIGGTQCNITNINDTELQCIIGDHPGGTYPVRLQNVKGYARSSANFKYELTLSSVSPNQGSFGGGLIITLTGSGFDKLTSNVSVCNSECKVDRVNSNSNILLCETPAQNDTNSLQTCDVLVVNGNGASVEINNSFSYSSTLTPVVYDVKNDFFYIDVWSSKYTWGGESPPDEGFLAVITQGQTILLDQSTPVLKMLLIQGGALVFDDADIELQSENILITDGGVLQIGTEAAPFQHKAIITLHGHLRSTELPLYGAKTLAVREGTLDLHGLPVPITWTHLGQTAEAVTSTITLKQSVTWKAGDEIVIASTGNRLSQKENEKRRILSVSADGKTLTLTEPLKYKHLGISITLPDDSVFEARAEVGLLTRNVVVRGSTNMDWSETIPACPDGFDPGEFATQTCFQGKFGEESNSDQFGGCIMFHAPTTDKPLAIGRIEYVEIFHAGQAFRLGRYPLHFHIMGDLQYMSYVRGCGIHQTYNRAVTIHNTHHLLIEHNVIYDIMGGAFFIEDGIEHGNVLQYNLAVFVRQSTSLLNDDVTPAAYWVTNPNNTIRHNAAAGGTHFGFWYRMHEHPDGLSYDENICQQRVPLGEFYNNTVHSQGWFGLWIFENYFPMSQGSCSSSTPQPAIFKSLTTWNCQKGAEWVQGGALQFHNFSMINNEDAGIETKRVISAYVGGCGEPYGAVIKNSVIIGHIDELGHGSNNCTTKGLILPFDDGFTVSSVTFMNFDRPNCVAIGVTSVTGLCVDRCGGWSAQFDGIQYFNTPNKAGFRWEHEVVLIDTDGTLAGGAGYKVIPESGLLDPSQCRKENDWSVGFPGCVCNSTISFHRLAFNNLNPYSWRDAVISNSFGASVVPFLVQRLTHPYGWMALLPDGNSFQWTFPGVEYITNISYAATFYGFKNESHVLMSHKFYQRPDRFAIIDQRDESLYELSYDDSVNGDWIFDDNTTTLTYISKYCRVIKYLLMQKKIELMCYHVDQAVGIYIYFHYEPIVLIMHNFICNIFFIFFIFISFTRFWSDRSFWVSSPENGYIVPSNGADVVIPRGTYTCVIADIALPWMNKLTICGTLILISLTDPNTDTYKIAVLNATYIFIKCGHLIAGEENDPFKGILHIILRGNHLTPEFPCPDGPNLGSKVIGVFGKLDLHGIPRSVYKTKLAQTALAGSTIIVLVEPVDWTVGEDILITTSSYSAWQTETRKIISVSSDNTILTLNASLTYTHIALTDDNPNTAQSYTLAADVALLSRNIKIIGEDYPGWYQESFGARVLVSSFTAYDTEYIGSAKIENVEFYHSGQEGFTDPTDPRYSLAFLNLGEVAEGSSYVRGCAFHNGFAPAIGIFTTNGLDIDDNVIHFTVGEGIKVWGERIRVRRNLVTLSVFPGTYRGRLLVNNFAWNAGIEINKGSDIVLQNNVVAGFERVGYRINGEPCPDADNPNEEWFNNEAHGGLFGVYMNADGFPGCSLVRRFLVWKCWDYGIYTQTIDSVEISDVILVDNGMGILPIVYAPPSVSHQKSDKTINITNSLLVGSSPEFDCDDVLVNSDANIKLSAPHRSRRPPSGGRSGICWPTFSSSHNGAPEKPHAGIMSYNAISGLMSVKDTTFVAYKEVCSGEANVMFMTNPLNEDLQHPVHVSGLRIVDSSENQRVFIHRPDVSKANPSDCVDMTCDAKRKALLKDLDGSFLGSKGAVVPQAEYQWNGLPSYGLGDYRIPKVMLTSLTGSRLPVSQVAPFKGVIRDSTCVYMSAWEGYNCTGLNYCMLVIESLDSDTETRRLSPVAVLCDGYLDLINGPQDHGWCSGYSCKKRVSLFHAIVATNKSFDVFFTSTSPQRLRLLLLNSCVYLQAVRVAIYVSNPQRLDVYANNIYIYPTNVQFTGQYLPQLTSTVLGENYFDRDYKMLNVMVRGSTPVVIRTSPLIVISFNLPAMTLDQFYGKNLINNLALFFNIPPNKIRITKIIAAVGVGRRRRSAGGLSVEIEIADPPAPQSNTTDNATSKCFYQKEGIKTPGNARILSSYLNVTVASLAISDPIPTPDDPTWSQGNCVDVSVSAMSLSAALKYSNGSYVDAGLDGNATILFSSCWANYTDLVVNVTGKRIYYFHYL
uniref:Fibrocystin-L n=1 Tax=Leptobrachium leishanense TaxID=445787 RepID=A0A8C5QTU9_9ANUR